MLAPMRTATQHADLPWRDGSSCKSSDKTGGHPPGMYTAIWWCCASMHTGLVCLPIADTDYLANAFSSAYLPKMREVQLGSGS